MITKGNTKGYTADEKDVIPEGRSEMWEGKKSSEGKSEQTLIVLSTWMTIEEWFSKEQRCCLGPAEHCDNAHVIEAKAKGSFQKQKWELFKIRF